MRSSIVYRYDCDTCQKVYVGATDCHFETRLCEHIKGKNNSEIGFHSNAPKKFNFKFVGQYKYPFIAETILLSEMNVNTLMNRRFRSTEIKLFTHGHTLAQLKLLVQNLPLT